MTIQINQQQIHIEDVLVSQRSHSVNSTVGLLPKTMMILVVKWVRLSVLLLFLLSLIGCQDSNTFSSNSDTHNTPLDKTTGEKYCQTYSEPFAYNICQVNQQSLLEKQDQISLQLFWRVGGDNTNKTIKPLYTFDALLNDLDMDNSLIFAVNAGMYNQNYAPIGYTVIDNKQVLSLNLNEGAGNFHLLPNGVFWWDNNGLYITESTVMAKLLKSGTKPKYATQSGPMLVINGKIHPKFQENSESKKLRNGIGLCQNGMVKMVNSDDLVNFYEFAKLFKDQLKCENALFLDGGIASALYSPDLHRKDNKSMGVMIGLVQKINEKK